MYERFTDRARNVMYLAEQEARRLCHEYVGTEHVLLGLIKEGSGLAVNVLKNLGVAPSAIRDAVDKILAEGPGQVTTRGLPQTPRVKKVIEFSMEESRSMSLDYIGTEHLLLGLLREDEGIAAQVLMKLGMRLPKVRREIVNLLEQGVEPSQVSRMDNRRDGVCWRFGRWLRGWFVGPGSTSTRSL